MNGLEHAEPGDVRQPVLSCVISFHYNVNVFGYSCLGLEACYCMNDETRGSVTDRIGHLKQGDRLAARPLWERYFGSLARLPQGRLVGGVSNLAVDGGNAISSAFDGSRRAAADGRVDSRRRVGSWKLQGYKETENAGKFDYAPRIVANRSEPIHSLWLGQRGL